TTGGPAGHDQRRGQGQGGQGATTGHDGTPSPLALSGDEGPSRAVRLATRAARLGRTQPIWITVSPSSPSATRMPPWMWPAWITTPSGPDPSTPTPSRSPAWITTPRASVTTLTVRPSLLRCT